MNGMGDAVLSLLAVVGVMIFAVVMMNLVTHGAGLVLMVIVWAIKNLWWLFLGGAAWYYLVPENK